MLTMIAHRWRHRWAIAPQYIEQFRIVLSIFKVSTPKIQRDCTTMLQEGWLDPGIFHSAILAGLKPGHTYHYRFGGDTIGLSQVFSFSAAPKEGPESSVAVLLIADMGQAEPDGSMEQSEMSPSLDTTRWMIRDAFGGEPPEANPPARYGMIAHYGDISYARGHVTQWDRYARCGSSRCDDGKFRPST